MTDIIMIILIGCLYVLLIWFVIYTKDRDKERLLNQPPELWRVDKWQLIDKLKVYNFLKVNLKEIKNSQ